MIDHFIVKALYVQADGSISLWVGMGFSIHTEPWSPEIVFGGHQFFHFVQIIIMLPIHNWQCSTVMITIVSSKFMKLETCLPIKTSLGCAGISMLVIVAAGAFRPVAVWLTKLENHRTYHEVRESLIIKLFVFEFINNYDPSHPILNTQKNSFIGHFDPVYR